MASLSGQVDHHPPQAKYRTFSSLFSDPSRLSPVPPKDPELRNGAYFIEYTKAEFEQLIAPYRLSLIGKFAYGRPKMQEIRKELNLMGFSGGFEVGLLNQRHIWIRFHKDEDYQRCWFRATWNVGGHYMRVLKWTSDFKFEEDPPIAPVWVSLYDLPDRWKMSFMEQSGQFSYFWRKLRI